MGPLKVIMRILVRVIIFFENLLRMQNSLWGIRDLYKVSNEGLWNGFSQEDIISMPSNNFLLVYRKSFTPFFVLLI